MKGLNTLWNIATSNIALRYLEKENENGKNKDSNSSL